ncbi:MAG TPA: glycosyltransferase family 4 protein [Anaerohalosphaeraceae bacterium]|nr:glycosyltransferase family 4 protein [Anaerohalosphaeraceae bacterium]
MKIVFFDFIYRFGGGPQLAADTMIRLSRHHQVEVVDPYGQSQPYVQKLTKHGVKVHILMPGARFVFLGSPRKPWQRLWRFLCAVPHYVRLRRRLVQTIRRIQPDLLWTNGKVAFRFLNVGRALRKIPMVMEVIGCLPVSYYQDSVGRQMQKRLSLVMAISTETAKHLLAAGFPSEKVHVVYDTIDFEETIRKAAQPLEAPLPGLGRHPAILVPATLIPKKGQDTAIRAVAELKAQGLNPVLWLAGDVVGDDDSYAQYLRKLAKELNVIEDVFFLGWRNDVPAILTRADMMVLPTHEEGFGHVVLEAMLLKCPVVVTPVGGIRDSVQDEVNGLVFPVGDDKRLAEQIQRLHQDSALRERLIQHGYHTVTERFTPENHTTRVLEGLERLKITGDVR